MPMAKLFLQASQSCPNSFINATRSGWMGGVFLAPLIIYCILIAYEKELTQMIIPLFPVEDDKSFGFYRDFLRLCFNEMLWLTFFLLASCLVYVYSRGVNILTRAERYVLGRARLFGAATIIATFVASSLIAFFALQSFANSGDEYVYLYQAETMSKGKLWNDAHPLDEFFLYSHIPQKDGISVGRFPPGWPLLLTPFFVLGISPAWLNPLLGALALALLFSFATRYYGKRVALWSVVSVAFTGFYLLNSASFFSHTACLLMVTGFIYCLYLHEEKRSVVFGLLAGACLGFTLITRYYNAVLIMIPVVVYLFYKYRWKSIATLFYIGVGCVPFFAFLFWYNYSITGNGLVPVTVWADSREGLGFGVRGHTPLDGIEHLVRRVFLFLYWSSPGLLLLYVIFLFRKVKDQVERFLRPEDYYLLMLMAGYFLYYHIGGNQYGPRFWFEGTPFLTLFVVKIVFESRARWAWALLVSGLIYSTVKLPYIIHREHQVIEERTDIYNLVERARLQNAVVLVSTHTGIIRPMGSLDLIRNGLGYGGDVIYVHDKGQRNEELMRYYPGRSFYRYVRHPETVEGKLVPVSRHRLTHN